MCRRELCILALLPLLTGVCLAGTSVSPATTLTAQTTNNTSAVSGFLNQTNGNAGAANVSKIDVHSLLYSGADTKVYAHLMLWFGGSNHMNVGYSSTDPAQVHRQITDMISRGIDGVIIDWYGPNNSIDHATKLVMAEAEAHPGFTFAIMVDQGAIQWDSCSGCSPQQALVSQLQYIEQTYFPSKAYMTLQGRPVVTNFNIDLSYSVDWSAAAQTLASQPLFLFQNNNGFTHVLSGGSYSWVMPTTNDYGMAYLNSFYETGLPLKTEETVGASYKGFNDSLASWGSNRIMKQQCAETWLQTFAAVNQLYNSGIQLSALQLVTWNDYEEGTEIESGIDNCVSVSASVSGNSLSWKLSGNENTVDHYAVYVTQDGQNLMALGEFPAQSGALNLCSDSISDGKYTAYVQAVGKPSIRNQMSKAVQFTLACSGATLSLGATPNSVTLSAGGSGNMTITVMPQTGSFNSSVALTCSGLPSGLDCAFSPASVTPGANAVHSVLTLADTSSTAAKPNRRWRVLPATWLYSWAMIGFAFMGKFKLKRLLPLLGAFVLMAAILATGGCGGKPASTAVISASSHSYVVTVNGTSGSVHLSTTVLVTVQ